MKHFSLWLAAALIVCAAPKGLSEVRYGANGKLEFPADYREWIYLSSGLGMTYGPQASASAEKAPFDNVFVNPSSYRGFLQTGHWPEKTVFVLEVRDSESHGSINRGGHFQQSLRAVEVEVKDSSASGGKWSFYDFALRSGQPEREAAPIPRSASCYSCHAQNGAVENTFVQFYPTLLEVARQKGSLRASFRNLK